MQQEMQKNTSRLVAVEMKTIRVTFELLCDSFQNSKKKQVSGYVLQFYKTFCGKLDDIIWKPPDASVRNRVTKTKSKRR